MYSSSSRNAPLINQDGSRNKTYRALLRRWYEVELMFFRSVSHRATERGCLLWLGSTTPNGAYGWAKFLGVYTTAHKLAWMLKYGPVPEGKVVCHTCDVSLCVNPSHLWIGSQKENLEDMAAKGRRVISYASRNVGDANGLRKHPEREARGNRHGSRTHPERVARGALHPQAKVTEEQVEKVWKRLYSKISRRQIAEELKLTAATVDHIANEDAWRHVSSPYKEAYLRALHSQHYWGERHPRTKLTAQAVEAIRCASGLQREIAQQHGVTQSLVSLIRREKIWRPLCTQAQAVMRH